MVSPPVKALGVVLAAGLVVIGCFIFGRQQYRSARSEPSVVDSRHALAKEKGAMTVDLYTALSGRPDLFPDGIHPNAAGSALIARTLHGALVALATEPLAL